MSTSVGGRLKDGYLIKSPDSVKQLHQLKKWQRKWFRLHDNGDLHYFDNEKSSKPSGVIPLLQLYRIFDAKAKDLPLSYCVGLEGAGKSYLHYVKAESADSFNAWLRVLRGFAEMVEVSYAEPSGSPSTSRRGTFSSDFQGDDERLRLGSTTSNTFTLPQSRYLSVSTKAKFNKKEGWMGKTGSNNKGWKDRYFKLSNGKLSYYKSEKADTLLGDIDLFECTSVVKASGKKGYGFDIEIPGRMYNLSTETELEQNDWITSISFTLGVISEFKESPMIPRSGSTGSNTSEISLGSSREVHVPQEGSPAISGLVGHERVHTVSSGETESPLPSGWSPLVTSTQSAVGKREDSVVQLLEAEVEALRRKVSSLESEVQASASANSQLQEQLAEERRQWDQEARVLREERETLTAQVEQLESSKEELETVNDSLQTQLEEHVDHVQVLQEEQASLRHDLDESNASTVSAEEDVKVYQQELTDMQQRLLEIEDVAKELQTALIKKGEDPETPIIARKFTGLTSSLGSPLGFDYSPDRTFPRLASQSAKLQQTLEAVEKERDSLKEELAALKQLEPDSDLESSLSEERLKRQMEIANLREECEAKLVGERESHSQEKAALRAKLVVLEETCSGLRERSKQETSALVQSLSDAKASISRLEEEVSSYKERVGRLQAEKEKALTDLNAIRKINRSMEKRISEGKSLGEGDGALTPIVSPSPTPNGTAPENPDLHQRLLEAEKSSEEVKVLLQEVQLERDQLKTQLEKLLSGMQNGVPGSDVDVHDISRFGFISKTRASTAASNKSLSVPAHAQSFSGAADMLQLAYQNRPSIPNGNDINNPPPKPRRPPRDLYQTQVQSQPELQQQHIRPRSGSFLQNLFGRH